jgi:pimeloyl-ACP methyl ester carboxylesterase
MNSSTYLRIDDRLGFVELAGDGQPVLCVHTAGQSGVQWREVLAELPSAGYQVLVPDLPGHGRSDLPADGPVTDLTRYRDWCLEVIDRLGLARPFVVGCSIGGKIALDVAAEAGDRLGGVVAMAADAWNTGLSVAGLERSIEDSAAPSRADRTYYGTLASCGARVPKQRAEYIAEMHRREDPVVSTTDLIGWSRHDLRERLGLINCPARLVLGEDDFWLERSSVDWTAERIPGCRYEVLAGIGHYPMEEIAGFPELLTGWLEEMRS